MLYGSISTLMKDVKFLGSIKGTGEKISESLKIAPRMDRSRSQTGSTSLSSNSFGYSVADEQIDFPGEVFTNFCVTDQNGFLLEKELFKATSSIFDESPDILNERCTKNKIL